jgi:hypothetical protein
MEIVEATGVRDGTVQASTLFRYDTATGSFIQAGGISESLADTLLENGAEQAAVARFREVKT